MSILVLDVETVPLASSLAMPYPENDRPAPSNYKSPEVIAAWREKDQAAWSEQRIKECSLTPRLGRIACLGWTMNDGPAQTHEARTEADEPTLLEHAWDLLADASMIVTFNGSFDLRFLAVRSIANHVAPTRHDVSNWFRRYATRPHFDCRAVLTGWDDRQTGKLAEWCAAFGIASADQANGADVYRLAQAGEWATIASHCASDVNLTSTLYERMTLIYQ